MGPARRSASLLAVWVLAGCSEMAALPDGVADAGRLLDAEPRLDALVAIDADAGAGASDAQALDAAAPDVEDPDTTALPDTAPADAEALDLGGDGGFDAGCVPTRTGTLAVWSSSVAPTLLSETGLYVDTASKTLAIGVEPFQPKYVLWSDGAEKSRWASLPECATIDTQDMDNWVLPVGTRFWKEFRVDGRRIETRFIARWGAGRNDYILTSYLWDGAESDATRVPRGVQNAAGTRHDIPPEAHCRSCHNTLPARALGFGAIQLSHSLSGLTIEELSTRGLLSVPVARGFDVPGAPEVSAALGYLHANCGNCHNSSTDAVPFVRPFSMRVSVTATSAATTDAYLTAVNAPVERFVYPGITHRVLPGQLTASGVFVRMSTRGMPLVQMPPLASEVIDAQGRELVRVWIEGL